MTQEWFESADFEKTANNDKKDSPSDSVLLEEDSDTKEESLVVEENPQANPEDKETESDGLSFLSLLAVFSKSALSNHS